MRESEQHRGRPAAGTHVINEPTPSHGWTVTVAVADVLCINVWEHGIGRFEASNLALLQTIIELSIELKEALPGTW